MMDKKTQSLLHEKFNPEGSDLRKAQLIMLELLQFLDKTCAKYKLTYWLDSGTLIGAARHGGFIPWDDDVDVCMPRKDANKLKKILGSAVHDNHIVLQTNSNDPLYVNSSWMTMRDLNSEYIQNSNFHNNLKYRGLQVDIFIVDRGVVPYFKKLTSKFQNKLIYSFVFKSNSAISKWIARVNYKFLNAIILPFLRLFRKKNVYDIGYGASYSNPVSDTILYPIKRMSFEGLDLCVPADVDAYLTNFYGDWRRIPRLDEIRTHNVSFVFRE